MPFTLSEIYGGAVAAQPVSTPGAADTADASPARTAQRAGDVPLLHNPTFLLVGFIALFLGLVHFSVGLGR